MTAAISTVVVDGKALAQTLRGEIAAEIAALVAAGHRPPCLAVVLVGDNPASLSYIKGKRRACERAGMTSQEHNLDAKATQEDVVDRVRDLNRDPHVDGILVQLPLPKPLRAEPVIEAIDPAKDVDGLHPENAGRLLAGMPGLRPCTPLGILEVLDRNGVALTGANAVVIGRSVLVGKPVALLLLERHATVTICHSRTRDLAAVVREADVVVAAAGTPLLVKGDWIRPGAAVIDLGVNMVDGVQVGDVDFEAALGVAGLITPSRGGVGPLTITMLLRNTLEACRKRRLGARSEPEASGVHEDVVESATKRTPLYETHRALGARIVPFAGFEMPVQYTSILEEHAAVRNAAGLFDVSHMGEIHLTGPGAVASVERLVTCPVATLRPGRVRYGLLCNEDGGVVDDVTVYRLADDALFLCVNASNIEKDYRWIVRHAGDGAKVEDRSDRFGLLALQGPASASILAKLATLPPDLKRFRFVEGTVAGAPALISRTGYTGSDGFELYVAAEDCVRVWNALLESGGPLGLLPCGLGARDTLRLEAALPLYGHELDDTTSPLEAGLGRFVKREAGGFLGAEAIERRAQVPATRALAGFILEERGIARSDYPILQRGDRVGVVTSGAPSPTLGKSIGLGYVPPALAVPGTRIEIGIRERAVGARVVATPFL